LAVGVKLNFRGWVFFFGVSSSGLVSLYGIYVKKVLPVVNGDQWRLLIYNTILSIFMMFPMIWIGGEVEGLKTNESLYSFGTWFSIFTTGIFGFLINIAVFLQIKFTSPLTNNISGTLKSCIQTLFAIMIYKNHISLANAIGIVMVIVGSFLYSNVKYKEMMEAAQKGDFSSNVSTNVSSNNSRNN